MNLKAVAMNQLVHDGGRLFRSIPFQLDSISTSGCPSGNLRKGSTVADARINGGIRRSGITQAAPDSAGFVER
jgi:hypothetical protein